jgi:predicted Zn-dependent protease
MNTRTRYVGPGSMYLPWLHGTEMSRWDTNGSTRSTGSNSGTSRSLGKKAADIAVALLGAKDSKRGGRCMQCSILSLPVFLPTRQSVMRAKGDLVQEGNSVLKGRTGEKIGHENLTIIDDPGLRIRVRSRGCRRSCRAADRDHPKGVHQFLPSTANRLRQ